MRYRIELSPVLSLSLSSFVRWFGSPKCSLFVVLVWFFRSRDERISIVHPNSSIVVDVSSLRQHSYRPSPHIDHHHHQCNFLRTALFQCYSWTNCLHLDRHFRHHQTRLFLGWMSKLAFEMMVVVILKWLSLPIAVVAAVVVVMRVVGEFVLCFSSWE